MGANQSSGAGGSTAHGDGPRGFPESSKICYYELLEIDRHASEDEVKKAYRKKALELHPDRNYGNVEETTKRFADVQSAYETLSDPQERAWYDTHREAILRDRDDAPGPHYEHNVRITTADDILQTIAQLHGKMDFSNSATGFYTVLEKSFDTLADEENLACGWQGLEPAVFPSFGCADDSYEEVIKPFYSTWNGFATKKTFSWMDIYHYSEAPDRRVRRMMEKENKRLRDEAIREFNDAVRSLVAFVKRRDPRFKPNVQTEVERQRTLRDAAAAQAARSRAINRTRHAPPKSVPEWMKSTEIQEDSTSGQEEEAVEELFECIVCRKSFKSENQYDSHEKSKRHVRAVQYLRQRMVQENQDFSLDKANYNSATRPTANYTEAHDEYNAAEKPEHGDASSSIVVHMYDENSSLCRLTKAEHPTNYDTDGGHSQRELASTTPSESVSSFEEIEHVWQRDVDDHILDDYKEDLNSSEARITNAGSMNEGTTHPRLGKAKEKRAKKAAQKSSTVAGFGQEFSCVACEAALPSKTQLFQHIKDFGHAQPLSRPRKNRKSKK